jgi:hypothetical protein
VVLEAGPEVHLGELDLIAHHVVDAADVAAIGAHNFHVFADFRGLDHARASSLVEVRLTSGIRREFRVTEPINLNKARKARAQADAKRQAAENRVRFGRTKAEKQVSKLDAERARRALEDKKRGE